MMYTRPIIVNNLHTSSFKMSSFFKSEAKLSTTLTTLGDFKKACKVCSLDWNKSTRVTSKYFLTSNLMDSSVGDFFSAPNKSAKTPTVDSVFVG
ncbi:hypothetical protein WICPIJ_001476 [Wickerhamomyces pijperi]|uniref:Uncharacterized protein n=1 Tax=Wickerhamomyces pijperi TaxID=599730 RepID=A0A9P8QAQ6_WICPI|nr:hypothetical protein WICPIJ_001476 [Wickerhamomyces pijperi]